MIHGVQLCPEGESLITAPIFTRLMSADQYGMYSLYTSWDSLIIVFATLNLSYQMFNNALVKYRDDQASYTSTMLGLSNLCTTALFGLCLLFHDAINAYTGLSTPMFLLIFVQYYFNQALALWTVKERFCYRYRLLCAITMTSAFTASGLGVAAVYFCDDKVFARLATLALVNVIVGAAIYANILRGGRKLVCLMYWKYGWQWGRGSLFCLRASSSVLVKRRASPLLVATPPPTRMPSTGKD